MLINLIEESIKRVLITESFKSKTLQQLFSKNHEINPWFQSKHINSLSDMVFNNVSMDLHNITDDMIEGVFDSMKDAQVSNKDRYITFNNGVTIVFNDKVKELEEPHNKKFFDRFNSTSKDRFYKEKYRSKNRAYNDFMDSNKMWNKDIQNGDKPYFNGDKETRHNSTPSVIKHDAFKRAKEGYSKN